MLLHSLVQFLYTKSNVFITSEIFFWSNGIPFDLCIITIWIFPFSSSILILAFVLSNCSSTFSASDWYSALHFPYEKSFFFQFCNFQFFFNCFLMSWTFSRFWWPGCVWFGTRSRASSRWFFWHWFFLIFFQRILYLILENEHSFIYLIKP